MALQTDNFVQVFERLTRVDLFGSAPPNVLEGVTNQEGLQRIISAAALRLPLVYQVEYAEPLARNLASVVQQVDETTIEALVGAIADQQIGEIAPQLQRF